MKLLSFGAELKIRKLPGSQDMYRPADHVELMKLNIEAHPEQFTMNDVSFLYQQGREGSNATMYTSEAQRASGQGQKVLILDLGYTDNKGEPLLTAITGKNLKFYQNLHNQIVLDSYDASEPSAPPASGDVRNQEARQAILGNIRQRNASPQPCPQPGAGKSRLKRMGQKILDWLSGRS